MNLVGVPSVAERITTGAIESSFKKNFAAIRGNLTNDGTNTYTSNARNQLAGISGAVTASFSYDEKPPARICL